ERTVTSGTTTHHLEQPFLVMATQNPIEMEGTYPLPEAQLDRFLMKILVKYPSREDLNRIVEYTIQRDDAVLETKIDQQGILELVNVCHDVVVAAHVRHVAVDLVMATQAGTPQAHSIAHKYIGDGSSPRGAHALVECGRVRALMRGRFQLSVAGLVDVAPKIL